MDATKFQSKYSDFKESRIVVKLNKLLLVCNIPYVLLPDVKFKN